MITDPAILVLGVCTFMIAKYDAYGEQHYRRYTFV